MERVFIKKEMIYKYSPNNFCIKAFTSNAKEADTNVPIEVYMLIRILCH